MAEQPTGERVVCPECRSRTMAIVPKESKVVEEEDEADGKVIVTCQGCGTQFHVSYRRASTNTGK